MKLEEDDLCYNGKHCLNCLKCDGFYQYNFNSKLFICTKCKDIWEVSNGK